MYESKICAFAVTERPIKDTKFKDSVSASDLAQLVMGINESFFIENGRVPASALIINDISLFSVELKMDNQDMKKMSYDVVYSLADKVKARAVCFTSEAWFANQHIDDKDKIPPSQRADKKEVILVVVKFYDDTQSLLVSQIIRDENGKVVRLIRDDNMFNGCSKMEGLMI